MSKLVEKVRLIDRYTQANLLQRHVVNNDIQYRRIGVGIEYKIRLSFLSCALDCQALIPIPISGRGRARMRMKRDKVVKCI